MRAKIIPYKMGSRGASALAEALEIRKVRHNSPTYRHRQGTVLINWGNTQPLTFQHNRENVLNPPENVRNASNKLNAFNLLLDSNVPTVEWTNVRNLAQEWVNEGATVFARTSISGHSGEGIVVVQQGQQVPNAPLYTKYKKKAKEYRAHVMNGRVFDVQEKRRANDHEFAGDAALIRSHHHGWVFCRDNLDIARSDAFEAIAVESIEALGLDFGAVDIIYNAREDNYYVLEVNTAVGLEGQTLTNYVNAFTQEYGN